MPDTNPSMHLIKADILAALMTDLFIAVGLSPADTQIVVDALMEATLAGYDSHGVMRVPRYVDELRKGDIAAGGEFKILRETTASAHVDAGRAPGAVTATRAVELACAKAAAVGVGCVSTKNSNDIGRLGSYLGSPARRGFLVLLMANDSGGLPTVAPHGGAARFFSTNPIAAGIPTGDGQPIIIDTSTSVTSVGSIRMHEQRDVELPEGWVMDTQGNSVLDPHRFFADPGNTFLLPLGGLLAGHKGYALQLLVDVLAGALGGAGVANGVDPEIEANALFVLAMDPDHFASRERFVALVGEMVAGLKRTPALPDVEEVLIPGERAEQERQRRQAEGIPLTPTTREQLGATIDQVLSEPKLIKQYRTALALE